MSGSLGVALGAATVFVAWCATCELLAHLSGWQRLARSYRCSTPYSGPKSRFQSARFRFFIPYAGTLVLGGNAQGLYLAALWPWRPGHPPLLIRWSELVATEQQVRAGSPRKPGITFTFTSVPEVSVHINGYLGKQLLALAPREAV